MEGLLFYWSTWSIWVYLTFIESKESQLRLPVAASMLFAILFSNFTLKPGLIQINAGGFLLLLIAFSFSFFEKKLFIAYFMACTFIIGIFYASLQLFGVFDPILFIFKKEWMIAVLIVYLAVMLQKNLKWRILILISGTMQGELLYSIILDRYTGSYIAGGLPYLDLLSLSVAILGGWYLFGRIGVWISGFTNSLERGKKLPHE